MPRACDGTCPLFVAVAGKDQIVDSRGAEKVFERVGTPPRDRTWRKLDNAWHTVLWDPDTPALVEELVRWVLKRSGPALER